LEPIIGVSKVVVGWIRESLHHSILLTFSVGKLNSRFIATDTKLV
jgi:hypothetical protein